MKLFLQLGKCLEDLFDDGYNCINRTFNIQIPCYHLSPSVPSSYFIGNNEIKFIDY